MARPRTPNALRHHVPVRFSDEEWDFLTRQVKDGAFATVSDVVRLGVDALALREKQELVFLAGKSARVLEQAAGDLGVDVETAVLIGTYLIALFAQLAPQAEAEVTALVERLKTQVGGAAPPN